MQFMIRIFLLKNKLQNINKERSNWLIFNKTKACNFFYHTDKSMIKNKKKFCNDVKSSNVKF